MQPYDSSYFNNFSSGLEEIPYNPPTFDEGLQTLKACVDEDRIEDLVDKMDLTYILTQTYLPEDLLRLSNLLLTELTTDESKMIKILKLAAPTILMAIESRPPEIKIQYKNLSLSNYLSNEKYRAALFEGHFNMIQHEAIKDKAWYQINDPEINLNLALTCARINPFYIGLYIKDFIKDPADQNALIQIAKACAATNGKLTAEVINNFAINVDLHQHELIKIGQICIEQSPLYKDHILYCFKELVDLSNDLEVLPLTSIIPLDNNLTLINEPADWLAKAFSVAEESWDILHPERLIDNLIALNIPPDTLTANFFSQVVKYIITIPHDPYGVGINKLLKTAAPLFLSHLSNPDERVINACRKNYLSKYLPDETHRLKFFEACAKKNTDVSAGMIAFFELGLANEVKMAYFCAEIDPFGLSYSIDKFLPASYQKDLVAVALVCAKRHGTALASQIDKYRIDKNLYSEQWNQILTAALSQVSPEEAHIRIIINYIFDNAPDAKWESAFDPDLVKAFWASAQRPLKRELAPDFYHEPFKPHLIPEKFYLPYFVPKRSTLTSPSARVLDNLDSVPRRVEPVHRPIVQNSNTEEPLYISPYTGLSVTLQRGNNVRNRAEPNALLPAASAAEAELMPDWLSLTLEIIRSALSDKRPADIVPTLEALEILSIYYNPHRIKRLIDEVRKSVDSDFFISLLKQAMPMIITIMDAQKVISRTAFQNSKLSHFLPEETLRVAFFEASISYYKEDALKELQWYEITSSTAKYKLALACAIHDPSLVGSYFSKFISPNEPLGEDPLFHLAEVCAKKDGAATAEIIKHFKIQEEYNLDLIKELCLKTSPKKSVEIEQCFADLSKEYHPPVFVRAPKINFNSDHDEIAFETGDYVDQATLDTDVKGVSPVWKWEPLPAAQLAAVAVSTPIFMEANTPPLPLEIWHKIISRLSVKDLLGLTRVSKEFRDLSRDFLVHNILNTWPRPFSTLGVEDIETVIRLIYSLGDLKEAVTCINLHKIAISPHQIEDVWEAINKCENIRLIPDLTGLIQSTRHLKFLSDFKNLQSLYFACSQDTYDQFSDNGLQYFEGCKQIQSLTFKSCTNVTDKGLSHFRDCTGLKSLVLEHMRSITDLGLINFSLCSELQTLALVDCPTLTNSALDNFQICRELQSLQITDCPNIANWGLTNFQRNRGLKVLKLENLKSMSNEGLRNFELCLQLKRVTLRSCEQITDDGLSYFRRYTELEVLDLESCPKITANGLIHLKDCQQLNVLNLYGCPNLSKAALDQFKRQNPNCKIYAIKDFSTKH